MLGRIISFYFFLQFSFRPNDAKSCEQLCNKISKMGVVALKVSQWYYNLRCFKYSDEDRPLYFQYLQQFLSQNDRHRRVLSEQEINSLSSRWQLSYLHAEPMAVGSIGQIHKARSMHDERPLILKLRHPQIEEELVQWERWVLPWMRVLVFHDVDLSALINYLRSQLDFSVEATNMRLVHEKYHSFSAHIKIPNVVGSESSMILMEDVPSRHIPDQNDFLPVSCFRLWIMDMILEHGILHGDLHFGNWGVGEDYVVIYDWGCVFYSENIKILTMALFHRRGPKEIQHALGRFFGPLADYEFMEWYQLWENHHFRFTRVVTQSFIRLLQPHFKFDDNTLCFLSFLTFYSVVDQYTFVAEMDVDEMMRFQLAVLRSKKILPSMQFRLENFLHSHSEPS
jgi:hypothetical protein